VLADLSALERLTEVHGALELRGNDQLASLDDLAALRTVGGAVTVTENPRLSPAQVAALLAQLGRSSTP
jgi:hypothetical protein